MMIHRHTYLCNAPAKMTFIHLEGERLLKGRCRQGSLKIFKKLVGSVKRMILYTPQRKSGYLFDGAIWTTTPPRETEVLFTNGETKYPRKPSCNFSICSSSCPPSILLLVSRAWRLNLACVLSHEKNSESWSQPKLPSSHTIRLNAAREKTEY